MRLAQKIFIASTAALVCLVAVAGASLSALHRLVGANQQIATRAVPAARLQHELPESLSRLVRLEARELVLRDRALAGVWRERAGRVAEDLARLGEMLDTEAQRHHHAEVVAAFSAYREHAEHARALAARGDMARARRMSEQQARPEAQRADVALSALTAATDRALARSLAEAAILERRTWNAILVGLAASLTAGLVLSGVLALRMTRSLRALAAASREVATGALREPVEVTGQDEIADLGRAFNEMAEQLRALDRLKEEFFAHVSHDLRNPLTAMRGAVQLMQAGRTGPLTPRQEKMLGVLDGSATRMLAMVNQIVEFSRLRSGTLVLDRRPLDLGRVAARAVDELAPQAEEKQVRLCVDAAERPFPVIGDEAALVRVVVNLAGNAIKFTPDGGLVEVRLGEHDGHVELAVADTGDGIPSEALARIFEPYQQAHRGRGGSGLGLAVVKGLVDAHDGTVDVESAPGRGSTFRVRLPAAPAASLPSPRAPLTVAAIQ
jgi:signal transduction histidine kinase